ncbi:amidase family protein [Microaceticoccus formicicus]|uniref:amidase family protein n=1 Tax=Microaceticoccus formicicus TaxID=3118105 RepID=UPI003CD02164|nr:amidase family protein [Peptoniphilaceae bacterium AMB_02]
MKNKIIIAVIVLAVAFFAAKFFLKSQVQTATEEVIMYDNDVIKTIDAHLQNLPIEEIRKKEKLIMEKSIEEIQESIKKGELTYTELTAFYMDRIRSYDKAKKGLNSVMEINPNAISEAKKLDSEKTESINPMYGIPVLVKDNINTKDMKTSAGTIALKDFQPSENAPVIESLIKNKAIILGKANLSELANFVDTKMPSGYSSKLGQTHNPFDPLMLTPSGSSSGSAVAVAANLSTVALGTETTGSIISPASINSIVGFKPSKDLISTEGVVPLSSTMDTVGPMTKTVKDAVALFNASIQDESKKINLNTDLKDLSNMRIGVMKGDNSEKLIEALKKAGAVPVELEIEEIDNEFILQQDFKPDFENFAKKYNLPVKNLSELVEFNKKDLKRNAKYGQDLIEDAAENKGEDAEKVKKTVAETKEKLNKLMKDNNLDIIAFTDSTGVVLPCIAGYPLMTVPLRSNRDRRAYGSYFLRYRRK